MSLRPRIQSSTRMILVAFVLVLLQVDYSLAQSPLAIGELLITIKNPPTNPSISVDALTAVYGSRKDWYPHIFDRWDSYSVAGSYLVCQFIDRDAGANADTFGYGKYRVTCMGSYYIDIDYRDADYASGAGVYPTLDLYLFFDNSTQTWSYYTNGPEYTIANGSSKGICEFWFSGGDHPRIPVTVRCNLNGGYSGTVVVDQTTRSSPYQTIWSLGSHSISAPAIQGGSWVFDHWSDGGAQSHTVNAGVSQFANVYTAYYRHELLAPENSTPPLVSYPNPFNPSTTISYTTQARGHVKLSVVDVLGREVAQLVNEVQDSGSHSVAFSGSGLASGIYYCRLLGPTSNRTIRIILAK